MRTFLSLLDLTIQAEQFLRCIRKIIPGVKKVITYNQKTRRHTPKTGVEGYDFSSVVNYPVSVVPPENLVSAG